MNIFSMLIKGVIFIIAITICFFFGFFVLGAMGILLIGFLLMWACGVPVTFNFNPNRSVTYRWFWRVN